jgi:hypothetical protein
VHVDEPRRNYPARGVDHVFRGGALQRTDFSNTIALNTNITSGTGRVRPVDDLSILDQDVQHGGPF